MGELRLPPASSIYIDSSILIYTVEAHAPYWSGLEPIWEKSHLKTLSLFTSELTILECLVGPLKKNDKVMIQAYAKIYDSPDLRFIPLGKSILWRAAEFRAKIPSLRTPDALHAATAVESKCDVFLTNDAGFKKIPELKAIILRDSIANID